MSPDSTPKYPQILEELRGELVSGKYAYGEPFPSEPKLMERFAASRPTIHRAIAELEDEGFVEVQRGVGTVVRRVQPIIRNIGKRLAAEVWREGHSVWDAEAEGHAYEARLVSRKRGKPFDAARPYLGSAVVWTRERVHFVDEIPVMLSWSSYPAEIVDGSRITEEDTGPGGAPAVLDSLGHAPHDNTERWRVERKPTPDHRKKLGLPRGTRALVGLRVVQDAQGRVVEVTEMVANSDAFVLQVDFTS